MALKFGRLTLIPLGILLSLPSCGKKDAENEGFIPKLSEITKDDVITESEISGNSLWAAVAAKLEIPDIDLTSATTVVSSLGIPSTLITDTTKATTQATAKTGAVVMTASQQKCALAPVLTDLTATIAAGLAAKGITITTGGFKIDATTGAPTNLANNLTTKVYLAAYKLNDDADFRYAFMSVPQTPPAAVASYGLSVKADTTSGASGYPLALYAHASTSGLSFGEIAKSLGDLQLGHIIVAPAFPGEKICISPDATNACSDDIGKSSVGTSLPYQNDVTDYLGLYECMKGKLATGGAFSTSTGGTETITSYAKISQEMVTNNASYGGAAIAAIAAQPITYTVGLGRGANVVHLAQQRAGAINSVLSSTASDTATTTAKAALTAAGIQTPETFSCSATGGGNFTYAHGKNKIYLNYWVAGHSDFLTEANAAKLEAIPGFKEIHATIAAIRDDAAKDEATKATEIAAYVQAVDSSFQMSLLHGSVANWGKMYRVKILKGAYDAAVAAANASAAATYGGMLKATLAKAQGSSLVLNGTKDVVADISNSIIASNVGAGVTAAIATEKAATSSTSPLAGLGGINWLALGVNEDGTDNGHVADASFLKGKTIAGTLTKMKSTVDETAFLDKTPVETIQAWLSTQCMTNSVSADSNTP